MDCEEYGITLSVPTITPTGMPATGSATLTLTATAVPTGV